MQYYLSWLFILYLKESFANAENYNDATQCTYNNNVFVAVVVVCFFEKLLPSLEISFCQNTGQMPYSFSLCFDRNMTF